MLSGYWLRRHSAPMMAPSLAGAAILPSHWTPSARREVSMASMTAQALSPAKATIVGPEPLSATA
jgi:hypothetical protein